MNIQRLILDLYSVSSIPSTDNIVKNVDTIIKGINLAVIEHRIHEFKNGGLTAFWLLAESHFAIHTWPESRYVSCEISACTEVSILSTTDLLQEVFLPKKVRITYIDS